MIHKLIVDGEHWLPYAMSCLRKLENLGTKYVSQVYTMPDGATVAVRVAGEQRYIKIEGSAPLFEFVFTSPLLNTLGPADGSGEVLGHVIHVKRQGQGIEASRKASNIWLPTGEPSTNFFGGKSLASLVALKLFQVNAVVEPRYYSKPFASKQYAYTWGSDHQFSRMFYPTFAAQYHGSQTFDVSYDTPFYSWGSRKSGRPKESRPETDYFGAGAALSVGGKAYHVMVDASNTLYVWDPTQPLIEGTTVSTPFDVATILVVTAVALPLPTWVTPSAVWKDSPSLAGNGLPRFKWEFSSTGSSMVAVVSEDLGLIPTVVTGSAGDGLYQFKDSNNVPTRANLLGMVEMLISVTVPDATPDTPYPQPIVNVSVGRTIRPSLDDRYIIAAGYGWDMGKPEVAQDDLLVIEQNIYAKPPDAFAPERYYMTSLETPSLSYARAEGYSEGRWVVTNVNQGAAIRNFCMRKIMQKTIFDQPAYTEPYERVELLSNMLAIDLKALSFVFETLLIRVSSTADVEGLALQGAAAYTQRVITAARKTVRFYRTYHNNELVQESSVGVDAYQYAPYATAVEAHQAIFESTPPTTGRLSLNAVVTIGTAENTQTLLEADGLTEYSPAQESAVRRLRQVAFSAYWPNYPVGSVEYGFGAAHMKPDPFGAFVCHPEGHFSVCLGPMWAYPEVIQKDISPFVPGNMVHSFIDIFRFRVSSTVTINTTHLALANEACATNYTYPDFYSVMSYIAPAGTLNIMTGGYKVTYASDGVLATEPPSGHTGFYPTLNRSLGSRDAGHTSLFRGSPRKAATWIGNFSPKLRAAGWSNT